MTNNAKEWIQYSTALIGFMSGVALAMLSFFLNEHDIESGTLMYIAQMIVYAASVFGITIYMRTKFGEFESKYKEKPDTHETEQNLQ